MYGFFWAGLLFLACGFFIRKLIVAHKPEDPTVSIKLWFQVGSQDDPKGKEGLVNLCAKLLAEGGTKTHSYEEILDRLYPMAASYSVTVDKEMTVFHGRVHQDHLNAYLSLFSQAICEPGFRKEDFDRIKSNVLNELENLLRYGNDEAFGKEAFFQFVFQGTSYSHPCIGLIESVKSITLEDVEKFYQNHFTFDNLIIGLGGKVDRKLEKRVLKAFHNLPREKSVSSPLPQLKPIQGLEVLLVEKETPSTAMSLGFPISVLRKDRDFMALWLFRSWFGEHRNSASHLYQVIREARGLNYGDYAYIEYFPNGWRYRFPPPNFARRQQVFEIWIRPVPNETAHFVLKAVLRELQKAVDNGMSLEAFERTKQFLKKYYRNYAPTTEAQLGYRLDDRFYGTQNFLKDFPKALDRLTLEELNSAIRRYLQYKNMKIVMITQDAEKLKEALVKDLQSPIQYKTPKPSEVLAEDQEIAKYPLFIPEENVTIIKAEEMFVR